VTVKNDFSNYNMNLMPLFIGLALNEMHHILIIFEKGKNFTNLNKFLCILEKLTFFEVFSTNVYFDKVKLHHMSHTLQFKFIQFW